MALTGTPTVGDIGTSVQLTIRDQLTNAIVNLANLVSATFTFERPDNTSFSVTAAKYTDGTDGVLAYSTVEGDFDQAGRWRVQPTYTLPGGTWTGTVETFRVKPLISQD